MAMEAKSRNLISLKDKPEASREKGECVVVVARVWRTRMKRTGVLQKIQLRVPLRVVLRVEIKEDEIEC